MKLFTLLFFTAIIFISQRALCQQEDVTNLIERLDSSQGRQRIDLLNRIGARLKISDPKQAKDYVKEAHQLSKETGYSRGLMKSAYFLGLFERESNRLSKAARYAEEEIEAARELNDPESELQGLELLAGVYQRSGQELRLKETELEYRKLKNRLEQNELEKEYEASEKALNLSESEKRRIAEEKSRIEQKLNLTEEEKLRQKAEMALLAKEKAELRVKAQELENSVIKNELKVSQKEKEILEYNARLERKQFWLTVLAMGIVAVLLLTFLFVQYYRQKRIRAEEKAQMQRQLMLQERMASLGQLTAGIAHEIKNPLNFVNNFAEGTSALVEEMEEVLIRNKDELKEDQYELLTELSGELKQNSADILSNGKRADSIIKSMMEHARGGSGEMQPTNVNNLLEENLNLAYHSYVATEPGFHTDIQKKLDDSLPEITAVPKDLSRVFLNLIANACYAVNQKQKTSGEDYRPEIAVKTGVENGSLVVRIRDNGPGIPADIREKIFTPFFTTKPTGSGNTGLGLSISYDIIVRQHQGKLKVESEPDEFTEFTIVLPISHSLSPVTGKKS